jgi:hypothetical protein
MPDASSAQDLNQYLHCTLPIRVQHRNCGSSVVQLPHSCGAIQPVPHLVCDEIPWNLLLVRTPFKNGCSLVWSHTTSWQVLRKQCAIPSPMLLTARMACCRCILTIAGGNNHTHQRGHQLPRLEKQLLGPLPTLGAICTTYSDKTHHHIKSCKCLFLLIPTFSKELTCSRSFSSRLLRDTGEGVANTTPRHEGELPHRCGTAATNGVALADVLSYPTITARASEQLSQPLHRLQQRCNVRLNGLGGGGGTVPAQAQAKGNFSILGVQHSLNKAFTSQSAQDAECAEGVGSRGRWSQVLHKCQTCPHATPCSKHCPLWHSKSQDDYDHSL